MYPRGSLRLPLGYEHEEASLPRVSSHMGLPSGRPICSSKQSYRFACVTGCKLCLHPQYRTHTKASSEAFVCVLSCGRLRLPHSRASKAYALLASVLTCVCPPSGGHTHARTSTRALRKKSPCVSTLGIDPEGIYPSLTRVHVFRKEDMYPSSHTGPPSGGPVCSSVGPLGPTHYARHALACLANEHGMSRKGHPMRVRIHGSSFRRTHGYQSVQAEGLYTNSHGSEASMLVSEGRSYASPRGYISICLPRKGKTYAC